ncbi:MAG TPA: RuvA C-terminal domain-containing protein [Polyangiaceae bacterium]
MQCSFQEASGRRCQARALLELDHVQAQALGGSGEAGNIRVLCRAHNRLHAEETFGRQHVEKKIHLRQKKCPPPRDQPGSASCADALPEGTQDNLFTALTNLGFRAAEARAALSQISQDKSRLSPTAPMADLLREALQLLTPDARV